MLNNNYNSQINKFFYKKIYISKNLKIEYFFFNNLRFLIFFNPFNFKKIYFVIPTTLDFFYTKNFLYFFRNSLDSSSSSFFFFSYLNFFLKNIRITFFKTILIKGTNYKISFLENSTTILKLKLGYSHLIFFKLFNTISIKLFKRKLLVKCFSKILLGNFCALLYKYRPINIFTGKGLLIKKRKKFKLKEYSKKI